MTIVASGQLTIIDLNDSKQLVSYIGASQPKNILYNPTDSIYLPNYSSYNQVLTPQLFIAGSSVDISSQTNYTKWFYKKGSDGILVEITSSGNGYVLVSEGAKKNLRIQQNLMTNESIITYICEMQYTDDDSGFDIVSRAEIDIIKISNGRDGNNGASTYTWIKYADDKNGANMSNLPEGKRYLGMAYNKNVATESNNPNDYTWSPLYDNVIVGGRNLVLESNKGWSSKTYSIFNGLLSQDWVVGETYFITIKGTVNEGQNFGIWRDLGSITTAFTTYDETKGVHVVSFVCPSPYPSHDYFNKFSIFNFPRDTALESDVEWIKIEKGNIGTDFTLAPEDFDVQIEGIKQTVGVIDNRDNSNLIPNRTGWEIGSTTLILKQMQEKADVPTRLRYYDNPIPVIGGATYTYSNSNMNYCLAIHELDENLTLLKDSYWLTQDTKTFDTLTETKFVRFLVRHANDQGQLIYVSDILNTRFKLEKGDKATAWTQSAEDINNEFESIRNSIKNNEGLYTWIKYANDVNGGGISNSPTGKDYIGIAYNKSDSTASNIASDYTWSLFRGEQGVKGDNAIYASIWTPQGNIIKNSSNSLEVVMQVYNGVTSVVGSAFKWYLQDPTATTSSGGDADGGNGWRLINSSYNLGITGYTTTKIIVPPNAVNGLESFKCIVTYQTVKYQDVCTVIDITDPITVTVVGMNTFKNGQGTNTITCKLYQNGVEIDANGSMYTYTWSLYNSNNTIISTFKKTGKTINVLSTEVDNRANLICQVTG